MNIFFIKMVLFQKICILTSGLINCIELSWGFWYCIMHIIKMLHFSSISYFISSLKRKKNRPTDKHTPNFSCLYIVILTYIEGKKSCLFSGGNSFLFFNQTTHFFPSLRIMWWCWENSLACKSHSTESISLDFGGRPWLELCVCMR